MTPKEAEKLSKSITKSLLFNITSRRGFRQEWDELEETSQKEIKKSMEEITKKLLENI